MAKAIFQTSRRSLSVGLDPPVPERQAENQAEDGPVGVREERLVAMPKGFRDPGELIYYHFRENNRQTALALAISSELQARIKLSTGVPRGPIDLVSKRLGWLYG